MSVGLRIATVVLLAFAAHLAAQQTMKITLVSGDVSEEFLAEIGRIVFSDSEMMAGTIYDLDAIRKIEFCDEAGAANTEQGKPVGTSRASADIGLSCAGGQISLTVPSACWLRVSLYDVNGRNVADLFGGSMEAGSLSLSLKESALAAGVYGLVVKADGQILARRITIGDGSGR